MSRDMIPLLIEATLFVMIRLCVNSSFCTAVT